MRLIGDVKTPPLYAESKKPGNGKDADGESGVRKRVWDIFKLDNSPF